MTDTEIAAEPGPPPRGPLPLGPDRHLDGLRANAEAIASLPAEHLDAPVVACPGWDVHDLVGHTGQVHRWTLGYLAGGTEPGVIWDAVPPPPAGAAVLEWYRDGAARVIAELERLGPEAPCHSFDGPGTAAFWYRRQAQETLVHRWDGEAACGRPAALDPALAADGVDEWATMFLPRHRRKLARLDLHAVLGIRTTDIHAGWRITVSGSEVGVEAVEPAALAPHGEGPGGVGALVEGPAAEVLLALWHRIPVTDVGLAGDGALAARFVEGLPIT